MTLLFINLSKEFYVREIARKIHFSASGTQKELSRLQKENVIISRTKGNLKLFSVSRANPSFKELKKLIIKSVGVVFYLKNMINEFSQIKNAFIYGSWAKGEADNYSDIDLFLIGNVSYELLNDKISQLEDFFGRQINFGLINLNEFQAKKKQKNPFIMDILKSAKIIIKGGEFEL